MVDGRVEIIAEAGVNHNGSIDLALRLVDAAAEAGADVVKFQTFRAEKLASPQAPKAEYQLRTSGRAQSQLEMLRSLELSESDHSRLLAHCAQRGIRFLSTAFDLDSLDLLTDHLGQSVIKLGSSELTNAPLLLATARKGVSIILSTGMGSLGEIERALGVLAFGYADKTGRPERSAFEAAYADQTARSRLRDRVILLHCTTEYPTPVKDTNLRAIDTMREAFGLRIGYSDHTLGIHVAIAAAARGAVVIEKHFTLDRSLPGPDHPASLEPSELTEMVCMVREVELSLGDGIKCPQELERKNIEMARKSICAAEDIEAGQLFTEANMAILRPAVGRSPFLYWACLGQPANRSYRKGELIDP